MNLFEYEGKMIFHKYGINIPTGYLGDSLPNDIPFPVVVKAQVLTGGRGKKGGIKKVNTLNDLEKSKKEILETNINGEIASEVYVEEVVRCKEELYVAIIMDRNIKSPTLIVGKHGGMDIESAPKESILRIPINPLIGLQPYMIQNVKMFLNEKFLKLEELLYKIWNVFIREQATLVEINPLFLLEQGDYIAGDAKITLDDDGERPESPLLIERKDNQSFESKCADLDTVGVELDGKVATVTSGAGLGMATFDLISSKGITVRALVDLGGHIIHDKSSAKKLIKEIKKLNPEAFLFNFYFQVASCLVIAEAISEELGDDNIPTIIRLKGQEDEKAFKILNQHSNIFITDKVTSISSLLKKSLKEVNS